MKRLYIFRGLPGSGKSTLANKMAAMVIEPDMFRYDADKRYVFDSSKNDKVFQDTELMLRIAMGCGVQCLAVAATHVTLASILRYISYGAAHGYEVVVVECYGDYGNIHSVPPAVVAKMAKEFEPLSDAEATRLGVKEVRRTVKPAAPEVAATATATPPDPDERWVVTVAGYGEGCAGKAVVAGVYKSRELAWTELRRNMLEWASQRINAVDLDLDHGSARYKLCDAGCEWNVEKITID